MHLFHDRKHFDPCYQHKHCPLRPFFATHNTAPGKPQYSFCFLWKELKMQQNPASLLFFICSKAFSCSPFIELQPSKQSKLVTPQSAAAAAAGQAACPGARGSWAAGAASDCAKTSHQPACLSETKTFRCPSKSINGRAKRRGGGRVTSSPTHTHSTVLSDHFSITSLLYGP